MRLVYVEIAKLESAYQLDYIINLSINQYLIRSQLCTHRHVHKLNVCILQASYNTNILSDKLSGFILLNPAPMA